MTVVVEVYFCSGRMVLRADVEDGGTFQQTEVRH